MDESEYICPSCGEEIIIPVDASQGRRQEYVEDCPICCRAIILQVTIHSNGEASIQAQLE